MTCKLAQTGLKDTDQLKKPMRVTYMPGGVGAVAYNKIVANEPANGDAIVAFSTGSLLNLAQGKFGQYTENDVRWLAAVGTDYGMVAVNADSPLQNLNDLAEALKKDPKSISFGAGGSVGGQDWLQTAMVAKAAGVNPKDMTLAKQGKAGIALSLSAVSSFTGSIIATLGVVLFAPLLANWAIAFGPAEYFVLMVFAITCLSGLVGDQPIKTAVAALIGLALATVGVDAVTGVYRFTFDSVNLSDGIQFTTIVIGFFSVSEILIMLEHTERGQKALEQGKRALFNVKEFLFAFGTMVRSGVVGFVVGILLGAGATIASAMTYTNEKKLAGASGKFGEGDLRGVAAPEAANNASACGSFIPMLTLGVPGSGTTAVMMGALTLYNITPGPQLFSEQPDIVWGLIASLFIGNVILLLLNIPLVGFFAKLLNIPNYILIPAIAAVSFVGVYAIHSTTFDLVLMVGLGVLGYFLRKLNFPLSALILGYVLGELMESSLRRALSISQGDLGVLFHGPITKVLWALALLMVLLPVFRWLRRRKQTA
ncbi:MULTISPECIES: tripartite tricarboxylate transporter permease [Neisseria]|uniref:Tripartite tricarboxylate transporter permease n=1 Tax=Neisseria brasiliensis TaxID=2666100 RepID=A0A7X2KYK9_9NEIS|nr:MULTISPECIES: tripartite tricarboxylate transporter permease [Neisseria]MRN38253.1 tripartite tricarboxylate transporter permease [Neisseria brasiliensis]